MSKRYYGSINLSLLLELAAAKHSAFAKSATNGKIYVDVTVWDNETVDKYGNQLAIQINPKKDSGDEKAYIGNLRPGESVTTSIGENEIPTEDELPF